eukprot:3228498-Lingulodinium_polyedra.AAC.1
MAFPWPIHGHSMDGPWPIHRLPTHKPWLTRGLPRETSWAIHEQLHGLTMANPARTARGRIAYAQSMDCPRTTQNQSI